MNVFKKIKLKSHLSCTLFILGCMFSGASNVFSQEMDIKTKGEENLTPGYVLLVTDYDKVRQQMHTNIQQGQGNRWAGWFSSGLNKNESLYWWLYGDWLSAMGQRDNAYKAIMKAYVITRLETRGCRSGNVSKDYINTMLQRYTYITEPRYSQDTVKEAVLESIGLAETTLSRNVAFPKMSCDAIEYYRLKQLKRPTSTRLALQRKEDDRTKEDTLRTQRVALNAVKQEWNYTQIWRFSETHLLLKSVETN